MNEEKVVQKLYAKPVEVTIGEEKAWLHPLKHPVEDVVCIGIFKETYELQKQRGCEHDICHEMAMLAHNIQRIMFSARKGQDKTSEHYFNDSVHVMKLGLDKLVDLSNAYFQAFEATEEELGESLRVNS